MERKNFLKTRGYGTVSVGVEAIEFAAVLAVILLGSLVMPILLNGHSGWFVKNNQFIIGPAVNCALIFAGINFRGWLKTAVVIFLPSVLALTLGLLAFSSIYAMYMIPAIWLGNLSIVLLFKYLHVHKGINFALTAFIAVAVKAGLIFGGYNVLVQFALLPTKVAGMMYLAMGVYQIITAAVGCVLAYLIVKLAYRKVN